MIFFAFSPNKEATMAVTKTVQDTRKKRRINKRKLLDEMTAIIFIIAGLILFVLNLTKTIPFESITILVAYGFIIGPIFIGIGIGYLIQVIKTAKSQ